MLSLERRLAELARAGSAAAATVLAEAIPHADEIEVAPLVIRALDSGDKRALAAVVARFPRLRPDLGSIVADHPAALREAIDIVLATGGERERRAVIDVIAARADAELAPVLGRLAAAGGPEVAPRAAHALLELVAAAPAGSRARSAAASPNAAAIAEAVTIALATWREHRLPEVLLAAAFVASRSARSLEALPGGPDPDLARAVRGVPALRDPLVRRNLIRWLGCDALGRPAARFLHLALGRAASGARPSGTALSEVLADWHLLLAPRRRRAIRDIDRPLHCAPPIESLVPLPLRSQLGAAELLARLDLSDRARRERVADLVASPHPVVRIKALTIAVADARPEWAAVAGSFCGDRNRSVARLALQHLVSRAGASADELAALERHGRARVARLLARRSLRELLARRLQLDEGDLRAAFACASSADRAGLVSSLRTFLASGDREARLWAIALLRRARLVAAAEPEVLGLAQDPGDARVAATAIAALADLPSPERIRVLEHALEHRDPRAAANALEALAAAEGALARERAESFLGSPHGRLRANAIVALSRGGSPLARSALEEMLEDADASRRASALWAARRSRDAALIEVVARRAVRDDVPEIRARASAVGRFLERSRKPAAAPSGGVPCSA